MRTHSITWDTSCYGEAGRQFSVECPLSGRLLRGAVDFNVSTALRSWLRDSSFSGLIEIKTQAVKRDRTK